MVGALNLFACDEMFLEAINVTVRLSSVLLKFLL